MPSRIFFFSDIDDTLIQTTRKTDFSKAHSIAGYNKEGKESSYIYHGVKLFIQSLVEANITFIPTTARNIDSYRRTLFYREFGHKYAILNFGGTVLIDNKIDKEWQNNMEISYQKLEPLSEVMNALRNYLKIRNLELVTKIIDGFYISLYNKAHLDNEEILLTAHKVLIQFLSERDGFYLYENGNSFGILPDCLNKRFAVEYLINKHKPLLTIGAGDNHSDLEFMNATEFHLIPNGSSIHRKRLNQ